MSKKVNDWIIHPAVYKDAFTRVLALLGLETKECLLDIREYLKFGMDKVREFGDGAVEIGFKSDQEEDLLMCNVYASLIRLIDYYLNDKTQDN